MEKWNGMDESGTVSIPELSDFAVSIVAASLPPASMITVGNRSQTFRGYARAHRPPEAYLPRAHAVMGGAHHGGLNAFEDRSPRLLLTPAGSWDGTRRAWTVDPRLTLKVEVEEGDEHFVHQLSELTAYVDDRLILRQGKPRNPMQLTLAPASLPPGEHRLVVNWASELGPVAVGVTKIVVRANHPEGAK